MSSSKGIIWQLLVLFTAIGVFIAIAMAPKNFPLKKLQEQQSQQSDQDMQAQINEVKNEMKKEELKILNEFELNFSNATGESKLQWMDSIIVFWDRTMRPAISAVYAKDKAKLSGKIEDYMEAGERFLEVAQFLKPEDKPWAFQEAKSIFEKVMELDPENTDAKINLGICLVETNPDNPMQGIQLLREVVEKHPENTRAILQLGHFSVLSGQYSKAIERYQQALEIDPNLAEAWFYLGDTYAKMGDMANAEKYLLKYRSFLVDEEVKKQLDIYLEDLKNMSNTKMN